MEMATCSVEFSFNDIMHRQIDGLALESPLGPSLANIFVSYYKSKLFQTTSKPEMYYQRCIETSKTLIDRIITNDEQRTVTSVVLILDLSDHYGVFAIISYNDIKSKISNQIFIRDMTKFIFNGFLLALNS